MNTQKKSPGCIFCLTVLSAFLLAFASIAYADVADYVGIYVGTYESEDGNDEGIFRVIISNDGAVQGITWSNASISGSLFTSTIDRNGNFTLSDPDADLIASASIDDSGKITLDYSSELQDASGTGSGQLVTRDSIIQYVGDYSLTDTDSATSFWLIIDSDGMVKSSDNLLEGAVGPDGKFLLATETGDTLFYGEMAYNGKITGYWYKHASSTHGSVSGTNRNVDDDGDGFTENQGDCNDEDATINPEAPEICGDAIDQDCDDADLSCDVDVDGDGYAPGQGDCNDGDPNINPGETEICGDDIDQDCNGADLVCDADDDGYMVSQGDCNDDDPDINPGATEICGDDIDQDCNGADLACEADDDDDVDQNSSAGCFLSTASSIL